MGDVAPKLESNGWRMTPKSMRNIYRVYRFLCATIYWFKSSTRVGFVCSHATCTWRVESVWVTLANVECQWRTVPFVKTMLTKMQKRFNSDSPTYTPLFLASDVESFWIFEGLMKKTAQLHESQRVSYDSRFRFHSATPMYREEKNYWRQQ